MSRLALVWAFMVLAPTAVSAQVLVLTDDFESYSVAGVGITIVAPNTFGSWTVTAGSVDLLRNYPGIPCRSGLQCVDDGGTGSSGAIQRTFTATVGAQYVLTFWYSGSQRAFSASDSMTVTLGTATLPVTNIPFGQGFTQGTVNWTASASGAATVLFTYTTGADNAGLMIDDVVVTATTPVPTLGEWWLIGLTLTLVGVGFMTLRRAERTA